MRPNPMTKPAATFLQLIGLLIALMGGGLQSWTIGLIGILLVAWGGYGVRKRIKG